jgi:hypothetical protein
MQKNEGEQERSPENCGEGAAKSQKNITISTQFHIKT